MVNKGKKIEITTKMSRKSDKRSEKMFWLGQKKFGKRSQKSEKNGIFDKSKKIGNPVWQL